MIDLWVMNNFSHDEQAAILKHLACGVRQVDRAFNAVAETKLLRQSHCGISNRNGSACMTHLLDDVAAVVRLDLLLHRGHDGGSPQVHFLAGCCAAGDQVRAHVRLVILSGCKVLDLPLSYLRLTDVRVRST